MKASGNRGEETQMQPDARHDRRVGAHHHEVAVRHVDDAHRAVGDGEAERDSSRRIEPRLRPMKMTSVIVERRVCGRSRRTAR